MFEKTDNDNLIVDETEFFDSVELDREEIPETDITFDCPHCGKSLSIDYRGAGLVIHCTSCAQPVMVPIPEGFEIEDVDATPEAIATQLLSCRQNLAKAQARVSELEKEVAELRKICDGAEKSQAKMNVMLEALRNKLAEMGQIQQQANDIYQVACEMVQLPE